MLYQATGISKQAVHQYNNRQEIFEKKLSDLLVEVDELRSEHPGCGVEKMYKTLNPDFIGRDKFIEIFMELGYRVQQVKNFYRTTIPVSHKYPNLIEGVVITKENMVWQSDITYFDVGGKFYYLVFIIDVYSRKIVGYTVSDSLRAEANVRALKMALKERPAPKIHHSDRGSQYVYKHYIDLLKSNGTHISMGLQAQDNAYAERVNGVIKNEYLKHKQIQTYEALKSEVKHVVHHYNNKRIHGSLPGNLSPVKFESYANKDKMVEIIYAPKRITPTESTFCWSDEEITNELYCRIN
jgi:putative transposase